MTSAAGVAGLPSDRLPHVALIGRSNVGKSSLINALVRAKVARTSAAPGKTRLINLYRVKLSGGATVPWSSLYFVDLPGYGYARGGDRSARGFEALTHEYFTADKSVGALLLVDARHPGLPRDMAAHAWIRRLGIPFVVVATKIDQLNRAERQRALGELETLVEGPVAPVSASTGEGLEALWKLIVKMSSAAAPDSTPPSSSSSRP